MTTARSQGFVVAAMAALVLLPNLGGPPLWDDDEPRNAACSLAMHKTGDWVVPTFNGRLRVEKPALVNWLHLAGFAVAGINETGARLASALLTLGSCLIVWRIGSDLFRPVVGAWAGIAMATCLWTGVAGRAATPDAPLVFFTTLALWLFVRGARVPAGEGLGWRNGPVRLSGRSAAAIGAACGLAVLAKGPIGLALPLGAFLTFAFWQAALDPARSGSRPARFVASCTDAWRGVQPLVILATAVFVAAPWYVAVTIRTDGEWLRGFLLVHNVGRFAATMEGHSGSSLLYYPAVVLIGTFPWSMASALIGRHAVRTGRADGGVGVRLLAAWAAAWIVPFSLAATKLPGYVWPAYPAIAALTGLFLADWIRMPSLSTDRWMRVAWLFLAASGLGMGIGLPLVANRYAPGAQWLGLVGLLPLAGAAVAWACQSLHSRMAATAAWGVTACATVAVLMAAGPACLGRLGGTRHLVARLHAMHDGGLLPIASYRAPPSTAFYAGRLTPRGTVNELRHPADVVAFVDAHPEAHLIVDARFEQAVGQSLPPGYRVLHETTTLPESRRLLLMGPAGRPAPARLADGGAVPIPR
jgi:4-amino-4-deoxy-L-arabinose transferase-like glycosyltransferase